MFLRVLSGRCCVTLLLALAAAGCGRGGSETIERAAPRVTVGHPLVRPLIDEDDYTGWLRPSQEVEVRSRVRGHIQKIGFRDGDMVRQGQLLFELDPRPFEAAIAQSEAQVRVSEAQRLAVEKDLVRQRELILHKAVAQSELDKTEADALSYAARIAAAMQEVEQHKLDLEYSRITAPISGRIGRALLTQGNLVNAGGTDPVLTTIVALDPIYVYFPVDERSLQRYQKIGQTQRRGAPVLSLREQKIPFAFGLDTDEGFPHAGVLDFTENKVGSSTGTIEVRGVVSNDKGLFVPGSRVRVRVPVSDEYQALLVPDTAVLSDLDRKYLLVLGQGNTVLRRDITPGRLLDDGMRVILPPPGEEQTAMKDWIKNWAPQWVILVGLQRARINYPVEPLDSNGQPIK
jgi:multidrug efflux system membrane fusion protein